MPLYRGYYVKCIIWSEIDVLVLYHLYHPQCKDFSPKIRRSIFISIVLLLQLKSYNITIIDFKSYGRILLFMSLWHSKPVAPKNVIICFYLLIVIDMYSVYAYKNWCWTFSIRYLNLLLFSFSFDNYIDIVMEEGKYRYLQV